MGKWRESEEKLNEKKRKNYIAINNKWKRSFLHWGGILLQPHFTPFGNKLYTQSNHSHYNYVGFLCFGQLQFQNVSKVLHPLVFLGFETGYLSRLKTTEAWTWVGGRWYHAIARRSLLKKCGGFLARHQNSDFHVWFLLIVFPILQDDGLPPLRYRSSRHLEGLGRPPVLSHIAHCSSWYIYDWFDDETVVGLWWFFLQDSHTYALVPTTVHNYPTLWCLLDTLFRPFQSRRYIRKSSLLR